MSISSTFKNSIEKYSIIYKIYIHKKGGMRMIGERLLDLRKEAGLTQDDLAAILSINKHSISSYERNINEPPDEIKIQIAEYFGVSVDYLLGITDSPVPYKDHPSCIRLPLNFPEIAMEDLMDHIDYLTYKYKSK